MLTAIATLLTGVEALELVLDGRGWLGVVPLGVVFGVDLLTLLGVDLDVVLGVVLGVSLLLGTL